MERHDSEHSIEPSARQCASALGVWLALALLSVPLPAAADETWLVTEVDTGGSNNQAAQLAREVERGLRARGLRVVDAREAVKRFEQKHSRPSYVADGGELERLDALLRKQSDDLASENAPAVRQSLAQFSSAPVDAQDMINRDVQRARRRFHNCLLAGYLFDQQGQTTLAQEQLSACARDFPGMDPELGGSASESVRDFLTRARATFAASPESELRIETEPLRDRSRCYARVNGIDRGATPVIVRGLRTPRVRVQVECATNPGRIYEQSLGSRQNVLHVDPLLDAAISGSDALALVYKDVASADAHRVQHGVLVARAVGATQLLELVQGKLRRIDVASGKELISDAIGNGMQLSAALDFVLSNGGSGHAPVPGAAAHGGESRPVPEVSSVPAAEPRQRHLAADIDRAAERASAAFRPSPPARTFRTLGWVAAGLTAVAAGTTLVAWRVHEGHVAKFNRKAECTDADPSELSASCQAELDSSHRVSTLIVAGAVTAGVGLVLTSVFLIVDANRKREVYTTSACGPGPGELGIACRLQF